MRRFYTKQHRFYCGIDLHARLLAICIVDHETAGVVCRTQIPADKQMLLDTLAPYRADIVVAVECLFAWYWVADLCAKEGIPFVLGHALYISRSTRERWNCAPGCAPRRAVELHGLTEASQGRTPPRKRQKSAIFATFQRPALARKDHAMLPCVTAPDLAGFDWPAARPAG